VLNRVSTSAGLIGELSAGLTIDRVAQAADRLQQGDGDAPKLLAWLALAGRSLVAERARLREEAALLGKSVQHIRSILAAPRGATGGSGVREPARVDELIADAVKLDVALESSGIELVRELEATPEVHIDRDQVLQIIVNLLSNARHAVSSADTAHKRIRVTSRCAGDACVIEVADTGAGIAADHLVKLFSYGFTTKVDGHGYGLHASAAAARALGGSLTARSDGPGCGAVFTLTLPLAQAVRNFGN
jgi:C4-dicarboxylate-specific signal transduction histidine kinase